MDAATYDRWRDAMALLRILAHAEADVERKAVVKQAEVWRRVEDRIARRVRDE